MKPNQIIDIDIKYGKFERPAEIESIRSEARANLLPQEEYDYLTDEDINNDDHASPYEYAGDGAFTISSGTEWFNDETPVVKVAPLFGNFWFQNEVCIFFADT